MDVARNELANNEFHEPAIIPNMKCRIKVSHFDENYRIQCLKVVNQTISAIFQKIIRYHVSANLPPFEGDEEKNIENSRTVPPR